MLSPWVSAVAPMCAAMLLLYILLRLRRLRVAVTQLEWQGWLLRRALEEQPADTADMSPTETPAQKTDVDEDAVPTPNDDGQAAADAPRHVRFLLDTLVLFRLFQHVCPQDGHQRVGDKRRSVDSFKEVFAYCTGRPIDSQTYIVSHLVPVSFDQQTATGVKVEEGSNIGALELLDQLGLPLVAHCHSHPGYGPQATRPSVTDHCFQERLERGGHIAVGLIFSRDGHVRFFSGERLTFDVQILGNRVCEVDDHVYRLSLADGELLLSSTIDR